MSLRTSVAVVLLLLSTAVAAQTTAAKPPSWANWKGNGVGLTHPTDWTVDQSGTHGTGVIFLSPLDSGDVFQENVNLVIQEVKDMDLPAYIALTEGQVRDVKGDMIHSATQRNGTGEYHTFEFTATLNDLPLHFKQEVRLRDGKAYLLTFTAKPEAWDEMLYVAEAMLGSFKWLD